MPDHSTFNVVGGASVPRSMIDLSHQVLITGDLGYLYPVLNEEIIPGDVVNINHELVIRFNPMVAPILHEVNAYIHTFFVANRIMWRDDDPVSGNWVSFITGGADGTDAPALPKFDPGAGNKGVGTLWDYLGFPTDAASDIADGIDPVAFPAIAYNMIYNRWFRDQELVTEVSKTQNTILKRAWEKDYFTSALTSQQRGTAPSFPVTLSGVIDVTPHATNNVTMKTSTDATTRNLQTDSASDVLLANHVAATGNMFFVDPALQVDISSGTATAFDIADLRLAVQQQRILERNARAGARYPEWLRAHFRQEIGDRSVQDPEYIGSIRVPVIVSEVLQTSESNTTAQGHMAGHGITVDRSHVGTYRAREFGVLMSILSVMPRTVYSQGVARNWIKSTRWDYYNPALAHLSEQAVLRGELYADATSANNNTVFGYQGRFNELRYARSRYGGKFRNAGAFDHWHIGRHFSAAPALNQTFIECTPKKDWLAASSEDAMLISVGNHIKAARPIPVIADPGLLDH